MEAEPPDPAEEGRRIRVLHVDDDAEFAGAAAAFVQHRDPRFEVHVETDAERALERLGTTRPDAVVSDYQMPGMDGLELLRRVRIRWPDLPFVLYTGRGSEEVASEAISAGVTDYLQKGGGTAQYDVLANRVRNAVERHRAEGEAGRMRRQFEALFDNPLLFAAVLDPDGRVRQVNETAREVIGATPADVAGRPFWTLPWWVTDVEGVADTGAVADVEELVGRAAGGHTVQFRSVYVVDGDRRTSLNVFVPVAADGGVERVLALGQDVTDWAREQEQLERQNERLAAFTSIVSHDLKNPLSLASGYLELAASECESEFHDEVAAALDRMGRLVDDLLALARQGETIAVTEPVGLGPLAEHCWAEVETGAATLEVTATGTVLADRDRLAQVLRNLYANAVEHGGDGVTVHVGDLGDGFYVEDDGDGIPPDRRVMVFEAGYSTSATGTGFGLRIVAEVVEAHGWAVRAVEGAAGGARFEVTGVEVVED